MSQKKQSKIVIKDAKRKTGQKGYKVQSIGKNGEMLQSSEMFNDTKAVLTNIKAMAECWGQANPINVVDVTKDQYFARKGHASAGK